MEHRGVDLLGDVARTAAAGTAPTEAAAAMPARKLRRPNHGIRTIIAFSSIMTLLELWRIESAMHEQRR